MELRFWGVRGTFPAAGTKASKFGSSTPCASIAPRQGDLLIVDAGTGIRALGNDLAAQKLNAPLRLSLFLTHFHLDHVTGLPFFAPLFSAETEIVFYSAAEPGDLERYLGLVMGPPFFPKPFGRTPAKKEFRKIGEEGVLIASLRVFSCPLHHPQGCVAYRFEENAAAIVFATDTEPPAEGLDARLAAFSKSASCLIYDAMFTPEEYASGRQGWGHSTWLEGTKTARTAGVGRLILSHLNPDHSDGEIRKIERQARRMFPNSECAREGMRLRFP